MVWDGISISDEESLHCVNLGVKINQEEYLPPDFPCFSGFIITLGIKNKDFKRILPWIIDKPIQQWCSAIWFSSHLNNVCFNRRISIPCSILENHRVIDQSSERFGIVEVNFGGEMERNVLETSYQIKSKYLWNLFSILLSEVLAILTNRIFFIMDNIYRGYFGTPCTCFILCEQNRCSVIECVDAKWLEALHVH